MIMDWVMPAAIASVAGGLGMALGSPLRDVIVRYAVPAGQPWRDPRLWYHGPAPQVVGALAAWVLAALALRVADPVRLAACCWMAMIGIALWCVDQSVQRLPDPLTMPAFCGVVAVLSLAALVEGHPLGIARVVTNGTVLCIVYLALFIVYPAGIGLGDAKLALSVGAVLGWYGWPAVLFGAAVAFILCGLVGAVLLVAGRVGCGDSLPHGPFMLLGVFVMVLLLG